MMPNHKKLAMALQKQGRHGDDILAHLSVGEAARLKAEGGSGTINPKTGLLEFYDGSSEDNDAPDNSNPSGGEYGNEGHETGYGQVDGGSWSGVLHGGSPQSHEQQALQDLLSNPDLSQMEKNNATQGYTDAHQADQALSYSALQDADPQGPSSYVGDNGIGANSWSDLSSGGNFGNAIGYGAQQVGTAVKDKLNDIIDNPVKTGVNIAAALLAPGALPITQGLLQINGLSGMFGGPTLGGGAQSLVNNGLPSFDTNAIVGGSFGDVAPASSDNGSEVSRSTNDQDSGNGQPSGGGYVSHSPGRFNLADFGASQIGKPRPVTIDLANALMNYRG